MLLIESIWHKCYMLFMCAQSDFRKRYWENCSQPWHWNERGEIVAAIYLVREHRSALESIACVPFIWVIASNNWRGMASSGGIKLLRADCDTQAAAHKSLTLPGNPLKSGSRALIYRHRAQNSSRSRRHLFILPQSRRRRPQQVPKRNSVCLIEGRARMRERKVCLGTISSSLSFSFSFEHLFSLGADQLQRNCLFWLPQRKPLEFLISLFLSVASFYFPDRNRNRGEWIVIVETR